MIEIFEFLPKIFGVTISQYACNFRNVVLLRGQQFKCLVHFECIDEPTPKSRIKSLHH